MLKKIKFYFLNKMAVFVASTATRFIIYVESAVIKENIKGLEGDAIEDFKQAIAKPFPSLKELNEEHKKLYDDIK
jgi:hypothetical protein